VGRTRGSLCDRLRLVAQTERAEQRGRTAQALRPTSSDEARQLSYESAGALTPLIRAQLRLNTTRAALDLPAEMVRQVNEVGESRRREREAKEQDDDEGERE
jgi:hypothetical protein